MTRFLDFITIWLCMSLLMILFPSVCLSEGFVAGVGPQGAYTAELSLDQSKVKKSSGLEKTEDEKFNCLFDANEEFMANVLVGGGEQPLPYGFNRERAHSGFQKFFNGINHKFVLNLPLRF